MYLTHYKLTKDIKHSTWRKGSLPFEMSQLFTQTELFHSSQ